MKIVLLTHPSFLGHQSMPRYANFLMEGMRNRGHQVEVLAPTPFFYNLPVPPLLKKWLGYVDQYILFPRFVKKQLSTFSSNTLFVFCDNALGPWVPMIANKNHIIHCHDFLAQQSALGIHPENKTSFTGKLYQSYIRRGYKNGKNFISVSKKTRSDLHGFLKTKPSKSAVVYNGLNPIFYPAAKETAGQLFGKEINKELNGGYFLHVGGNDWYKNRIGVIEMYLQWRQISTDKKPLVLVGSKPSSKALELVSNSEYSSEIFFCSGIGDEVLRYAYAGATAFLFPSLAEGFGWPIAEAMACGCPVITTNEAPMTEVAGDAAFFVSRMPAEQSALDEWKRQAAMVMNKVANLSNSERLKIVEAGLENAKRFDAEKALDQIEETYLSICKQKVPA